MIHLKLINQFAADKPDALVFKDKRSVMTWNTYRVETERKIALLLSHYGKSLPHQASYIAKNRIDLMPWLSALATLGIPVTGIDYSLPHASQKALNFAIGADLIFVSSGLIDDASEAASLGCPDAMVFDLDSITSPFNDRYVSISGDMLEKIAAMNIPPRSFRAISFTSGTTSLPKQVLRYSSFDQQRFKYFSERYNFSGNDMFLLGMPVYHAAGNGWARLFLTLGASVYLSDGSAPDELAQVFASEGITATVMTPVMLDRVLNATDSIPAPVSPKLKWLLVGGKHFPVPLKLRALSKLGPCLYEYYGTTETGVNTIAEPEDLLHYPASVGKAYSGNAIAIVGPGGDSLPPMRAGNVAVDSYMNMAWYGDGSAPAVTIDGKRYLVTPEQGYLDEAGRLYLLNRSERTGNHTDLYGLEDAIRRLPGVADVALLQGIDGEQDSVACVLTLRTDGAPDPMLSSNIEDLACKQSIHLKKCEIVPSIPYSPSGKVRVRDLISLLSSLRKVEPAEAA